MHKNASKRRQKSTLIADRFITGRGADASERRQFAFYSHPAQVHDPQAAWCALVAAACGGSVATAGGRVLDLSAPVLSAGEERKRKCADDAAACFFSDRLLPSFKLAAQTERLLAELRRQPRLPKPKNCHRLDVAACADDFYAQNLACSSDYAAVVLGQHVYVCNQPMMCAAEHGKKPVPPKEIQRVPLIAATHGLPLCVQFAQRFPDVLLVATSNRFITVWNVSSMMLTNAAAAPMHAFQVSSKQLRDGDAFLRLETMPDGSVWLGTRVHGDILVLNARCDQVTRHWTAHPRSHVCKIAASPDGQYVATGGNDNTVHVYHCNATVPKYSMSFAAGVNALAWSPAPLSGVGSSNRLLAIGSGTSDTRLVVWDVSDNKVLASVTTRSQITGVAWNAHPAYCTRQLVTAHGFGTQQPSQNGNEKKVADKKAAKLPDLSCSFAVWSLASSSLHYLGRFGGNGKSGRVMGLSSFDQGRSFAVLRPAGETLEFWRVFHDTLRDTDTSSASSSGPFERQRLACVIR